MTNAETDIERLAFGRRAFLQAAAIGGAVAATPWFLQAKEAWAAPPIGPTDGVLVIVILYGGNDGLNTVVPYENGKYYDARKSFAIAPDKVLPIGNGLGLHPNLAGMKSLWDAKKLAIVQGVGYSDPNLSHFDSMAIWMAGHADPRVRGTGWIGRYLDGLPPDPFNGVLIGYNAPPLVRGASTVATVLPAQLGRAFGADRSYPAELHTYDAVIALGNGAQRGPLASRFAQVAKETTQLAGTVQPVYSAAPGADGLSRDLVLCAGLVNANLGIRVLTVADDSGYDTHSGQRRTHDGNLARLDKAISDFYAKLKPEFRARTTIMTLSEFGRRVEPNGSQGTDHGTASCMFVMGDMVRGGLYGQYPSLADLDRAGNLKHTVDFRSVYASVLGSWLKGRRPGDPRWELREPGHVRRPDRERSR